MHFFEFNGSAYVFKFLIETNDSKIEEISILDSQTKFMFAGSSQKISAYTFTNGSFSLSEQLETGLPPP